MLRIVTCDGGNKARLTEEITKQAVKTIARGMPGVSGVTVVTNSCAFYSCTRGCGCADAPGIPCALFIFGGRNSHKNSRG